MLWSPALFCSTDWIDEHTVGKSNQICKKNRHNSEMCLGAICKHMKIPNHLKQSYLSSTGWVKINQKYLMAIEHWQPYFYAGWCTSPFCSYCACMLRPEFFQDISWDNEELMKARCHFMHFFSGAIQRRRYTGQSLIHLKARIQEVLSDILNDLLIVNYLYIKIFWRINL